MNVIPTKKRNPIMLYVEPSGESEYKIKPVVPKNFYGIGAIFSVTHNANQYEKAQRVVMQEYQRLGCKRVKIDWPHREGRPLNDYLIANMRKHIQIAAETGMILEFSDGALLELAKAGQKVQDEILDKLKALEVMQEYDSEVYTREKDLFRKTYFEDNLEVDMKSIDENLSVASLSSASGDIERLNNELTALKAETPPAPDKISAKQAERDKADKALAESLQKLTKPISDLQELMNKVKEEIERVRLGDKYMGHDYMSISEAFFKEHDIKLRGDKQAFHLDSERTKTLDESTKHLKELQDKLLAITTDLKRHESSMKAIKLPDNSEAGKVLAKVQGDLKAINTKVQGDPKAIDTSNEKALLQDIADRLAIIVQQKDLIADNRSRAAPRMP